MCWWGGQAGAEGEEHFLSLDALRRAVVVFTSSGIYLESWYLYVRVIWDDPMTQGLVAAGISESPPLA